MSGGSGWFPNLGSIRDSFRNLMEDSRFPAGTFPELGSSHPPETRWERYLRAYSPGFHMHENYGSNVERGNNILLPAVALNELARMNVQWPMLFELRNNATRCTTNCGVLEFTAQDGTCILPYWVMQNLCLEEGDMVHIANVSLPKGSYAKLQPFSKTFLDISNPRAVLEMALRHFATLTVGDRIVIPYNDQNFEIEIVELLPANAISVRETDISVDFMPPKDYVEVPQPPPRQETPPSVSASAADEEEDEKEPAYFQGSAFRLDGKTGLARSTEPPPGPAVEDEQPWLRRIPGGVRARNDRFQYLLERGRVKKHTATMGATVGSALTQSFAGVGRRLDD